MQSQAHPTFPPLLNTSEPKSTSVRFGDHPASRMTIQLVSLSENIPVSQILHASRRSRPIAEARMLAMYLIHVCCGLNLTETGMIFGRDRTTVRHACASIEDQRDDVAFDDKVASLELQIEQRTTGEMVQQ